MAKQAKQLIVETKNDFARLQEELESAKKTRDDFQRLLDNARKRLKRRENEERATIYTESVLQGLKKEGQLFEVMELFLLDAIKSATESNTEFALKAYMEPLQEVAKEKDIYKFLLFGTGWAVHLNTQIVMEESAGSLHDWGQAISDYREFELNTKGLASEKSGEQASSWFATHVYDTGLHNKTVAGRLNYTPTKAPFWQILDSGESPMISDRPGGYSVANNKPTGFVNAAEQAINKWFNTLIEKEHEKVLSEEEEILNLIKEYERNRDEFSQEVTKLRTDMRQNESIFKSFKDKKETVDRDALTVLLAQMETNRRTRTYNIAKAGSKEAILVKVIGAKGIIEY